MPVPALVSPPVPLITPEKVVDVLFPPVVRVPVPSVTLPTPAREPIVSAKLFRSKVAPPATTTALVLAMRLAAPSCKVPTLMVVAPVYELLPERVRVPAPFFVSPPVPLMTPLIVSAPALFRESNPVPSATFPATVETVVDCNEIVPAVVVSACAVIPPGLNGATTELPIVREMFPLPAFNVVPAPIVIFPTPASRSAAVAAESFAVREMFPLVVLTLALTAIERPACIVIPTPALVMAIALVTVMSLLAWRTTFASWPLMLAGVIMVVAPRLLPNRLFTPGL